MKRSSSTFLPLLFLLGVLGASDISAQTCSLKLNVSNRVTETRVRNATATAVRSGSNRLYRSTNLKGSPYFARLAGGSYSITVRKAYYHDVKKSVSLTCDSKSKTVDIPMQPKIAMFTIGAVDEGVSGQPSVSGGATGQGDIAPPPPIPTPPTTPRPVPKIVSKGVLNGSAISLPTPVYPPTAKAVGAEGPVNVQVTIDENGNVISAVAVSGHPLLKQAAAAAARGAQFRPTLLSGIPVKVTGIIVYNFTLPKKSKVN